MSGSLSKLPNFVPDAFATAVKVAYAPEDVRLGVYTFLPWTRTGLASIVQNPGPGEIRAKVTVSLDVEDDKGGKTPVQKTLTLRGPGDVLGIQPSQIVRRYPAPNTPDAQDTFLAYVEFDRPELPWLFTPFAPSGANQEKLPPWLALVVLEAKHASFEPAPPATPPLPIRVRTRKGELQPLTNSWAFAHAQVTGDAGGVPSVSIRADGAPGVGPDSASPSIADRLTDEYAPINLSRIICPRRLDDGVNYVACLVPAFDCGVKVAMGLPGGTLDPAWTRAAGDDDEEIVLPVYDHWRFTTAKGGDFEELARRLVPIAAPWKVGRRIIDTHHPRGGVTDLAEDDPGRVQVLKCALFSPASPPPDAPSEDTGWSEAKRTELMEELNRNDAVALSSQFENVDLPKVGARIYARFQRGQARLPSLDDTDWFCQLNTNPTHRIVAGLGTRVVQKDQEQLMQAAWAQVGEIDKANRAIVRAQYARHLGTSLHKRHLDRLSLSSLVQVTRTVQGKIKLDGSPFTVRGDLEHSFVAPTAADLTFRRTMRPRGAIARIAQTSAKNLLDQTVAPAGKFRDFRRLHQEPDGITGLRPITISLIPKTVIAKTLGVPEADAVTALRNRLKTLERTPTAADQLLQPVTKWQLRDGSIDLGKWAGERMLEILKRATPVDVAREPARAEAIGSLIKGIADSGVEGVDTAARELTDALVRKFPESLIRGIDVSGPVTGGGGVVVTGPVDRGGTVVSGPASGGGTPVVTDPTRGGTVRAEPAAGGTVLSDPPRGGTVTGGEIRQPAAGGGTVIERGVSVPRVVGPGTVSGRAVLDTSVADAGRLVRRPLADRTVLFESPTSVALGMKLNAVRQVTASTLANTLASALLETQVTVLPAPPPKGAPMVTKATLMAELQPAKTVTSYARARLKLHPSWLPSDWFADGLIEPIMAAPEFTRPMYEALDAYDRDWLVPGLGLINRTDFVTLLETNPVFTEAFLIGLSDEMGRELLWREYPTDQRGTYFKHFWDDDEDELTSPIHRFTRLPLGQHVPGGASGRVVFVVRGELVKRYPDAVMFALRQVDPTPSGMEAPVFADPNQPGASAPVIFQANLAPDILLVGFDLKVQQVRNEKWWFFIAEHPTAPRFGLDVEGTRAPAGSTLKRNDLDWNDIPRVHGNRFIHPGGSALTITETTADPPPQSVQWPPASSAVLARILLQNPIRAAFEGRKLLDDIENTRV